MWLRAGKPAQQLQRLSGDMEDSEEDETEEEEEREDEADRKVKVEDDESDSSSDEDDTPAFIKPEPSLSLDRFLGVPAEMLLKVPPPAKPERAAIDFPSADRLSPRHGRPDAPRQHLPLAP